MLIKNIARAATLALMVSLTFVGCNKGSGKTDAKAQAAQRARTAFNTCLQRSYDQNSCYGVQTYTVCSLSAYYYGQCGYSGNNNGGYYGGYGQQVNPATVIDNYFNSYLVQFSETDINNLVQQWNYMVGGYSGYPQQGYNPQQPGYYPYRPY